MKKINKLYSGVALFLIGALQILVPNRDLNIVTITMFWSCIYIGVVLVSEHITRKLNKTSLVQIILRNPSNLFWFIVATTAGGLVLDGSFHWLGKLWVYPYFTNPHYGFIFIPGFAAYFLMIAESYLACKAILDKLIKPKNRIGRYFKFEARFYNNLGIIGLLLLGLCLISSIGRLKSEGAAIFFNINVANGPKTSFWLVIALLAGVWFVCEYIEYKRRRSSLLKDIFHHYWNPILAVLLATAIGQVQEIINESQHYWHYVNWPASSVRYFGLPVMIIFAWLLHYIMFLSLFRAVAARDSDKVWRGSYLNQHRPKA